MFFDFLSSAAGNVFSFGIMMFVTLAVVITVHEFGHYLAARLCGVRVETFAFGFGRELFGFDRNHTRWSIRVFPVGGYVKLFGDVDRNNPVIWDHAKDCKRRLNKAELVQAFCTKNVWQRMFIVGAGPLVNIFLTFFLFMMVFTIHGQRSRPPIINVVAQSSPADEAGVRIGDKIIEMDGKAIRRLEDVYDFTWYEYPPQVHRYMIERDGRRFEVKFKARHLEYYNKKGVEQEHGQTGMVRMSAIRLGEGMESFNGVDVKDNPNKARAYILNNLDRQVSVSIPFRGDRAKNEPADPFYMIFPAQYNQHLLDPDHKDYDVAYLLDPDQLFYVRLGVFEAFGRIVFLLGEGMGNSYKVIKAVVAGRNNDPVVGGVAKISQNTGEAVEAGWYSYLMFLGIFSFMIAVINLLPIPALDGGYLMFLLYELITGQAISPRIQDLALIIGLAILLGIMIFANISDFLSLVFPVES